MVWNAIICVAKRSLKIFRHFLARNFKIQFKFTRFLLSNFFLCAQCWIKFIGIRIFFFVIFNPLFKIFISSFTMVLLDHISFVKKKRYFLILKKKKFLQLHKINELYNLPIALFYYQDNYSEWCSLWYIEFNFFFQKITFWFISSSFISFDFTNNSRWIIVLKNYSDFEGFQSNFN